jgi:GMP synthase-like glutamine amidotransferase
VKPLVCVRHQVTAPLGIIEEVLDREGVEWRYHDCWNGPKPPDVDEVSGLVVLGGAMNADEVDAYPYLAGIRDLVRAAVEVGRPVLGICLGAQILGRALGGDVSRAPKREIGFVEVESTGVPDGLLEPFAPKTRVFQFHEDIVSLPEGAELLFTGREVAVQAFRFGTSAYGIQFHFEVTMREVDAWCGEVVDLEEQWGASKQDVLQQARAELDRQQQAGREVALRFVRLVKNPAVTAGGY